MIARHTRPLTNTFTVRSTILCFILIQNSYIARATTLPESVDKILNSIEASSTASASQQPKLRAHEIDETPSEAPTPSSDEVDPEKRAFVTELLLMLHEQYGTRRSGAEAAEESGDNLQSRQGQLGFMPDMVHSLLRAIGADGDARRLIEWIRNTFSAASVGDLTTQVVVSKLGAVNCPALLRADKEDSLVPRFLLFNEHYVDVPYELSISPDPEECTAHAKFDPHRKTIVLVHGYLTGYTLVNELTSIKNRLLDLNRIVLETATDKFAQVADSYERYSSNGSTSTSYVFTDDLSHKIRSQLYNVIFVDWFNGANPRPRASYIRAAVNARVVGRLIARFLSALVTQCGTRAANFHIVAHSLGCHVSGFTGKAMNAAGQRLGRITHLDPVGLCFGRLFSQPRLRLSPSDALDTQAVHTSLNIFDNPMDGAQANFLVNGGRNQPGCDGQSEVKNSTYSSVALLFDPAARFGTCSHMRAMALLEEDHSSSSGSSSKSKPGQCQLVGYRCPNYDTFLAGKCGQCSATNAQCRLVGLPPVSLQFERMTFAAGAQPSTSGHHLYRANQLDDVYSLSASSADRRTQTGELGQQKMERHSRSPARSSRGRRADRGLLLDRHEWLALAVDKIRAETRTALASGWTNLAHGLPGELGIDDAFAPATAMATNSTQAPATSQKVSAATSELPPSSSTAAAFAADQLSNRVQDDPDDQRSPIGAQGLPPGSVNMPQYFLGTGALAPYCVNYYQFRVLISDSRLRRILKINGLGSNRLLPQLSHHRGGLLAAAASSARQRHIQADGRETLHLTVKLNDARGRFFKGFSMLESARELSRVPNDLGSAAAAASAEPLVELTMLLNSTKPEPVRISETIISYYFHQIVLADRIEINYMSNISPE